MLLQRLLQADTTHTALLLGNQTGQQTAHVKHMSTATLVGQGHSRRERRGRGSNSGLQPGSKYLVCIW